MKIKNYDSFINESNNTEIETLISDLIKNYQSTDNFWTDQTHYEIKIEEKEWEKTFDVVELQKTKSLDAKYRLEFIMNEKPYKLNCKYKFNIFGQEEKDEPDPGYDNANERLSIVLDSVEIINLDVKSEMLSYSENPKGEVKRLMVEFIIKMMKTDYDSLSTKIYKIEY